MRCFRFCIALATAVLLPGLSLWGQRTAHAQQVARGKVSIEHLSLEHSYYSYQEPDFVEYEAIHHDPIFFEDYFTVEERRTKGEYRSDLQGVDVRGGLRNPHSAGTCSFAVHIEFYTEETGESAALGSWKTPATRFSYDFTIADVRPQQVAMFERRFSPRVKAVTTGLTALLTPMIGDESPITRADASTLQGYAYRTCTGGNNPEQTQAKTTTPESRTTAPVGGGGHHTGQQAASTVGVNGGARPTNTSTGRCRCDPNLSDTPSEAEARRDSHSRWVPFFNFREACSKLYGLTLTDECKLRVLEGFRWIGDSPNFATIDIRDHEEDIQAQAQLKVNGLPYMNMGMAYYKALQGQDHYRLSDTGDIGMEEGYVWVSKEPNWAIRKKIVWPTEEPSSPTSDPTQRVRAP